MQVGLTRRDLGALMIGVPLAASSGAAAAAPASTQVVDDTLRDGLGFAGIPGVVAFAADRNGVLYHGAFGTADIATNRPMTEDAMFRIASMTKPIASLALMQFIEQGRFTLDDPVEKHLPEFRDVKVFESFDHATGEYKLRAPRKSVTVRHLLTHTSGIAYGFVSPIVRDFKPRNSETYRVGPLLFDPGERWHYGTSTDWVGRLVEVASGESLDAYFRDHIFTPLKMADTHYSIPSEKQARLVATHHREQDSMVKDATQPPPVVRTPVGSTGLTSTGADYIRFLRMYLNGGILDGVRLVSADTIADMSRNHIGALNCFALKTSLPDRSSDFSFIADGRDKWGLGFLIAADDEPGGGPSAGSLSWGGIFNTYFWIDRAKGVTGTILMQFLPFADPNALALYDTFKRAIYRLAEVK